MKTRTPVQRGHKAKTLTSELLILSDGRILVHNLTGPFAVLLRELNPHDQQIASRAPAPAPTLE